MLQVGQTLSVVGDSESPLRSPNTCLIAAALASGFRPLENGGYVDSIEQSANGPIRQVRWIMDGDITAEFRCGTTVEHLTFGEFRKRYESREWCMQNADHPIAYLRAGMEQYRRCVDFVKTQKPMAIVRRGNRWVLIPADASPQRRQELLSMLLS